MTRELERQLSEHYRRLDPAMAPLSLSERLDEVVATAPPRSSRRPVLGIAAVLAIALLGIALASSLLRGGPAGVGNGPPTPVLDGPVLGPAAAVERVSNGDGPFIVSGWITYDGSASCPSGADPKDFDDRCPDGWYLLDRDPYGPGAPATRLRLALATDVGTAIIHSEVLLRVHAQDRALGTCPTVRHGCEPLLAVDDVVWADRLAVHVDNRSAQVVTISIAGAALPADGAQTEVTLAPSASIDLAVGMTDRWAVEVDGQVVLDSLGGSPAGPILVTIDASGAVRAEPLVP